MASIIVFFKALSDMSLLILMTLGALGHSNNTASDDEIMSTSQYIIVDTFSMS